MSQPIRSHPLLDPDPEPKPEPEPEVPSCGMAYKVLVNTLNIRSGPSTSYKIVSTLAGGDVVDVRDIAGSNAGVEIAPGQWVCLKLNGTTFLKKVT